MAQGDFVSVLQISCVFMCFHDSILLGDVFNDLRGSRRKAPSMGKPWFPSGLSVPWFFAARARIRVQS